MTSEIAKRVAEVTADGTCKIADLGLSRELEHPPRPMTAQVVTIWYRAPELLFGAQLYGFGVRVWGRSLGEVAHPPDTETYVSKARPQLAG